MATFNPNDHPAGPGPDPLLALLEQSLVVSYLASGCIHGSGLLPWTVRPYTVLCQPGIPTQLLIEGQEEMTIPAGCGAIVPEGLRFRSFGLVVKRPIHWAHFRFRVLGELDLFHLIQSPYIVAADVTDRMIALSQRLAAMQEETTSPLLARVGERRHLCTKILRLVLSVCEPRPGAVQSITSVTRIVPALRFMREQMARPIFLAEMAKTIGLSPTRFDVVFRKATRQTPLQYLTQVRIQRAQELLLSTQQSISEIGELVGFRDAFHFSRTFKRYSGAGPREYRQGGKANLPVDG